LELILRIFSKKKKRLAGGGRHLIDKDFDSEMAKWVRFQREKKIRVSRRLIQIEARKRHERTAGNEDEEDRLFQVSS
jgi:hypothetical protein